MKTRVNLLTRDFKPEIMLLNMHFALFVWAVALLIMLGAMMAANSQLASIEIAQDQMEQELQQQQDLLGAMITQRDSRQRDPAIEAKIKRLEAELGGRERILLKLHGRHGAKAEGYAQLMDELARHHVKGLWLTDIGYKDGQVQFSGAMLESALLAEWILELQKSDFFAGQAFSEAKVFRDSDDQLRFRVGVAPKAGAQLDSSLNAALNKGGLSK